MNRPYRKSVVTYAQRATKPCPNCGKTKSTSEFYRYNYTNRYRLKDGTVHENSGTRLTSQCRACLTLRSQAYVSANREKFNAYQRRYWRERRANSSRS